MSPTTNRHISVDFIRKIFIGVACFILLGCGAVGPPLPPEKIGIEAKIRQQEAQEEAGQPQKEKILPIGEEEVVLPPLQPVDIN